MESLDPGILLSFALYLIFMLWIGIYFYRRNKDLSDYILGGRGLNSWVTALSAQASDMSGWLLLGLPGYAYRSGMEAFWLLLGLLIGTYLNWKVIARRLRIYTEIAGSSLTLPDYFTNRFKTDKKFIRIVSAIFILIFFLIYTASGFVAGAKLFNTVFNIPYFWALITGVVIIISYTFLGGFMAVSWTDFVQGSIMFFAVIIVPALAIYDIGGLDETLQVLNAKDQHFLDLFTGAGGEMISLITIFSLLGWGFGYFGQPHILARFMAIRNAEEIKQARRIAMTWVIISLFAATVIGIVGFAYVEPPLDAAASETVFMLLVSEHVHSALAGVLLAAILAAVMSTADSQLLVTSSALTEDLYHALLDRNASEKELLLVSRISVIIVAVIALLLAFDPDASVLELVAYAWAGFGAAFGPLIIISLFWKRMTLRGAIAGILSGGITVVVWKQLEGGLFDLYEIIPGFILSSLLILVFSLTDKEPEEDVLAEFEAVTAQRDEENTA